MSPFGRQSISLLAAVAAALFAALLLPAASLGHDPGAMETAADHAEEDAVSLSAGEERRMESHAEGVTATDAADAADAVPNDPAQSGSWGPVVEWPVVGIFVALMPNGKVLAYDSNIPPGQETTGDDETFSRATLWDPETGVQVRVDATTGVNIFCSGLAHLMDGRLFVAGGNKSIGFVGIKATNVFDSDTNTWTRTDDMQYERWYPTVTPLANGEMLITEGHPWDPSTDPHVPEVREVGGQIRQLASAPLQLDLYPWMDVAPDGRAYVTGPGNDIRSLDTSGQGHWQGSVIRDNEYRSYGSHALYGIGKILVAGGGGDQNDTDVSSRTAKVIHLNGQTPQVSSTDPMEFGRRQHNLTVLADGTVLATGGNYSGESLVDLNAGVYNAELWKPAGGHWRTLAAEAETRQYHSTALLLPDGRVLSAGGGVCGTCNDVGYLERNAQVFSPPYLFKKDGSGDLAARPVVSHAPKVVGYDAPMSISSPDAASIDKVALMRLGAVTHSVNMEQRYVPLIYTVSGGKLTANSPRNANIAPPGYYMLFAIDSNGVPSMAKMVRVDLTASPPPAAPSITATEPASPANANSPKVKGTAATGSAVSIYSTSGCTGPPLATDTAARFASPGITVAVGDNTITHLRATATDSGDNISDCSAAVDFTEDSDAPAQPTPSTSPPSPANQNSPRVTGNAESDSTVKVYSGADCNGSALVTGSAAAFASPGFTVTVSDDSSTDFQATATDAAGNVSECSSAVRYVEDSTPPAVPTIGVSPASPANQNKPVVSGTAEGNSTVRVYSSATCSGGPSATDTAAEFASPGLSITVGDDTVTDFRATATDAAGNVSNCSSAVHYVEDSTAPDEPSFTTDPPSPANENDPRVIGTAENGSTVKVYSGESCSGGPLVTDTASKFASPGFTIPIGDNTVTDFRVRASDAAGNVSNCSSAVRYVEDSTAPVEPAITDTDPGSPANDNAPEVKGTAEAGSTVKIYSTADCTGSPLATDTAAVFGSPGITVTVASDATTDLQATATDPADNVSPCSGALPYIEDSSGPAPPSLTATDPASPANENNPAVKGEADQGSTVKIFSTPNCSGAALATGTADRFASPGITVAVGDDQATDLRAAAVDSAGNSSTCSNALTYVEDSTGPDTAAEVEVEGTTAIATFSSESGATFSCNLDGGGFSACQSPTTFARLATGEHALAVRATDPSGNADPSPAEVTFRVEEDLLGPGDKTAPSTRIDKKPKPRGTKRRAVFRLTSSEPRSTFACRLDGEDEPCGYRLAVRVDLGRHRLTAAAIDQAGNVDRSPARYSWRVKRSTQRSRVGGGLIAAARAARLPD